MREKVLRKWHRHISMALVLFIIAQVVTGILLSMGQITGEHVHNQEYHGDLPDHHERIVFSHPVLKFVHHGGGTIGMAYRLLVGTGLLWIIFTGGMIFLKELKRKQER
jgi:phosphotransferase system  glucose/maltose/N-acetylglucosamine-specific IIC component